MSKKLFVLPVLFAAVAILAASVAYAMPASQQANTADLAVSKGASPSPAVVGSDLTYTLTVTNNGPLDATNVVLTDTLPGGVTFVSHTPSQGSCSGPIPVSCPLGTLASGASATVTIVVQPTDTGTLSNTVSVSADQPDGNQNNSVATLVTTVGGSTLPSLPTADLRVSKSDSPDPVQVNSTLTYTVTVENRGPATATSVTLTDILIGSATLVSTTPSQGSCSGTGPVTCSLGDLAKDASATITLVVTPTAAGHLTNVAVATSATPENATGNNVAIERTRVHRAAEEAGLGKIEFTGVVQAMPSDSHLGQWKVQGLTVNVTEGTEVKGDPQVGSFVKVEGTITPDGIIEARELKAKGEGKEKELRDKEERPGHGFGDRNHEHSGPPGKEKHHDDDDDDEDDDDD
jgi:uncharacterized repeat protein (TIGR01451 family)